jgi:hypothetical protein
MAQWGAALGHLMQRSWLVEATSGNFLPSPTTLDLASRAVTIDGPWRRSRLRWLLPHIGSDRRGGTYIGLNFRDFVAYWRARRRSR